MGIGGGIGSEDDNGSQVTGIIFGVILLVTAGLSAYAVVYKIQAILGCVGALNGGVGALYFIVSIYLWWAYSVVSSMGLPNAGIVAMVAASCTIVAIFKMATATMWCQIATYIQDDDEVDVHV